MQPKVFEMIDPPKNLPKKKALSPEESGDEDEEEELSDQEDIDGEDEDFSWFEPKKLMDDSYFVFVNCDRRTVKKGEQAFYCYGMRSNAFLLLK